MEDQIRARANVNYWKMQDQKSDDAGREMQDQTESYLLIGAVAKRSGCISLAVVVVAVSDTLLYFITTAQNHIQRLKLTPLSM